METGLPSRRSRLAAGRQGLRHKLAKHLRRAHGYARTAAWLLGDVKAFVRWRLLGIVMPGVIFGIALLAVWLLEVPLGVGILIGAVLAPTDPVLASTVGLGPPGRGEEGEVRFSLTSEAGLNDGLAFPFVVLGTAMLAGQTGDGSAFLHWALVEVLWKVLAGVVIGGAIGGNAAGAALKNLSLGSAGNTIAGAIGGGVGGQILQALIPVLAGAGTSFDIGAVVGQLVGGGVAGAIVTAIIGAIKNR